MEESIGREKEKFLDIQREKEFQRQLELLSIKEDELQHQPMHTELQQPMLVHEHKQLIKSMRRYNKK